MPEGPIQGAHLSQDVQEFLRLLHHHGVRFLLVGGEAVIYYGYPRFTGDIDFYFACDPPNCQRLFRALVDFWGEPVPAVSKADDLEQEGMVFQFGRPPNRIDLLSRVDGLTFDEAWDERHLATLLFPDQTTQDLPILSLSHLIAAKQAAGRPKDLDDLRYLLKLRDRL